MIGGSKIPLAQWPTGRLIGVGLVLLLMFVSVVSIVPRVARVAWQQKSFGFAFGAAFVAVFFGTILGLTLWDIGKVLRHRWRSGGQQGFQRQRRATFIATMPQRSSKPRRGGTGFRE